MIEPIPEPVAEGLVRPHLRPCDRADRSRLAHGSASDPYHDTAPGGIALDFASRDACCRVVNPSARLPGMCRWSETATNRCGWVVVVVDLGDVLAGGGSQDASNALDEESFEADRGGEEQRVHRGASKPSAIYWSKGEHRVHRSPTANMHDAIAAVELALTSLQASTVPTPDARNRQYRVSTSSCRSRPRLPIRSTLVDQECCDKHWNPPDDPRFIFKRR